MCFFCLGRYVSCDEFTVSRWSNRKIDDIYSHLRDTTRNDEIESFHSTECLPDWETKTKTSNPGRRISRKAEFDHGNNVRDAYPRRKKPAYGLQNQMKKQGMLYENDRDDQWISTSNSPSKSVDPSFTEV